MIILEVQARISSVSDWSELCADTTSGRVCGTVIGAAYRVIVRSTLVRVASSATALENASQRRSGSGPVSSRKGRPSVSSTRCSVIDRSSRSTTWPESMVTPGRRDR